MWRYWLLTGLFSVCCGEIRHRSISPALTHIPVPDVLKCNDWLLSSRFDIEPREHAAVGRGISSITLISLSLHMWLLVSFSVFVFVDDVHLTRCVKKESLEANALTVPINHPAKILTCWSMRSMRGEGAHRLWRHCEKKKKPLHAWLELILILLQVSGGSADQKDFLWAQFKFSNTVWTGSLTQSPSCALTGLRMALWSSTTGKRWSTGKMATAGRRGKMGRPLEKITWSWKSRESRWEAAKGKQVDDGVCRWNLLPCQACPEFTPLDSKETHAYNTNEHKITHTAQATGQFAAWKQVVPPLFLFLFSLPVLLRSPFPFLTLSEG